MSFAKFFKVILRRIRIQVTAPSVTVEFPYVVRSPPQGARSGLRNNFSECIGCHKCETACPVHCMAIASEDFLSKEKTPKTSHGVLFEKRVTAFNIDFAQCVNCGVCVDVCPTGSLTNDKNFIYPRQSNKHLLIDLVHRPRTLRVEQGYEN